ncbi:MAG TPA: Fe-S cluster assembly protein SufD [Mycobacteriales bacterium]|jgi:Fe-S cluster assembly protein SufD|nr:Fe-S cluster assembly protein SufD [Mycobacteriales bacterium]
MAALSTEAEAVLGYADRASIEAGIAARTGGPGAPAKTKRRIFSSDPEAFPVPNGREEEWRFTPLPRLRPLLEAGPSTARLELSTDVPDGVQVRHVASDDPLLAGVPTPVDRLAALAFARADGALVVQVPNAAQVEAPVVIRLTGRAGDVVWGHLVLDVGAQAKATVIVEHAGDARYSACVSVLVGDGAALDLVSVQAWDRAAIHASHHGIRLGRDASLRSTHVSMGGDLVRVVETVEFTGPGADVELAGLQLAADGQHLESRLLIDHTAPQCRSRVLSKAALQGAGTHTVWVGDVVIGAAADGTDTYETNKNLVLSDGARADSVPNLEIETGEVTGAGHASATGRFDDEQLFYLQTRGIPQDEARRLVVRGFFAEILDRVPYPPLHERLLVAVDRLLEDGANANSGGGG